MFEELKTYDNTFSMLTISYVNGKRLFCRKHDRGVRARIIHDQI